MLDLVDVEVGVMMMMMKDTCDAEDVEWQVVR